MNIEIRQQVTRHVITGQEVRPPQYEILCDNRLIGFLGYEPNAKPLLIARCGPLELAEINRTIRRKMHPHPVGDSVNAPDPPIKEPDDQFDPFAALDESET